LQKMSNSLDAMQSRRVATTLELVDAQRQPWSEFSRREFTYTWLAELPALFSPESRKAEKHLKTKFYKAEKLRRQTMTDFAARAYELDKGKPPASFADLVPDYLKAIPKDPLTGTNMVYAP
jgi:hypothetical protein